MDNLFFDLDFEEMEQLPRTFIVNFDSAIVGSKYKTKVSVNGQQVGDLIDDNSRENDFYRFHDVFHYSFAAFLAWSPCTRAMMKRKRKSDPAIDEFEDGARATITEEAISLIVFNKAKQNNFFEQNASIDSSLLNQIKEMTHPFEVAAASKENWRQAILKSYSLFRELIKYNGGKIYFNMLERSAVFEA